MGSFPTDFPIPLDQGGPGQGQPMGGIGGNASGDQSAHRAKVQSVGKAPVLLLHGNGGSADSGQWNMLNLKQMLMQVGYPDEIIWAPSYLGSGVLDPTFPHTNNVNDVRDFIDAVEETMKNGRKAIKGKCPTCGTVMFKILGGKATAAPAESAAQASNHSP